MNYVSYLDDYPQLTWEEINETVRDLVPQGLTLSRETQNLALTVLLLRLVADLHQRIDALEVAERV